MSLSEAIPILLRFDEKNLGQLEIGEHDSPLRLVAHTGFADEVGPFLFKMDDGYHQLGHYLCEDGFAGELEGKLVGYIRNIRVVGEMRGRGLGGQMLDAAVEAMRHAGVRRVFLHATPERGKSEDLVRFYERHGFAEFSEIGDKYAVMMKKLKKAT